MPARTQSDPGEFTVRALAYGDAVVRALEAELQQEYAERYGGVDESPVDPSQFAPPHGVFLVGFAAAEPVASGGFCRHDDEDHRGIGYARRLLAALEARAAEAGYLRVVLETGMHQPEAMALYESSGYRPIPGLGSYAGRPLARSFGKELLRAG